jgi:hypothetical protein
MAACSNKQSHGRRSHDPLHEWLSRRFKNRPVAVGSTKSLLTRNAGSGARRTAPYLITVAPGIDHQLDLSLSAGAVVDQDSGAGSHVQRLSFGYELRTANVARSKYNTQSYRSREKLSHVPSRLALSPVQKWQDAPARPHWPLLNPGQASKQASAGMSETGQEPDYGYALKERIVEPVQGHLEILFLNFRILLDTVPKSVL